MALLLDLEPPSSQGNKDDKHNLGSQSKIKAFWIKFFQTHQKSLKRLYFLAQKSLVSTGQSLKIVRKSIRLFFERIIDNKLLPHLAISFLFIVVAFSNINDRVQAYNLTHEINNLDPNIELSVVSDVGQFTPPINNSAKMLEKAILTSSYSSGFIYNPAPTDTQITARTEPLPDNSANSVYYVVRNNDTLSGIGWKFGVKIATLSYMNDLSNSDLIKPGVRLKIPVRGYEVPVALIAQKQQSIDAASAAAKAKVTAKKLAISRPAGSIRNAYPYGYCTYYVATRRAIPGSWGNAGQWLSSARRAGWATGSSPSAGDIAVLRESIWGHVAYVESVDGDQMTLSEMNVVGWGIRSSRTISIHNSDLKGFIK